MKDWRKLKSPSQLYVKNPLIFHSFFLSLSLSLSCFISRSLPLSKFFTCFDATAYTRVSRYDDIPLFCGLMMIMMMLYKGNLRRINTTLSLIYSIFSHLSQIIIIISYRLKLFSSSAYILTHINRLMLLLRALQEHCYALIKTIFLSLFVSFFLLIDLSLDIIKLHKLIIITTMHQKFFSNVLFIISLSI